MAVNVAALTRYLKDRRTQGNLYMVCHSLARHLPACRLRAEAGPGQQTLEQLCLSVTSGSMQLEHPEPGC